MNGRFGGPEKDSGRRERRGRTGGQWSAYGGGRWSEEWQIERGRAASWEPCINPYYPRQPNYWLPAGCNWNLQETRSPRSLGIGPRDAADSRFRSYDGGGGDRGAWSVLIQLPIERFEKSELGIQELFRLLIRANYKNIFWYGSHRRLFMPENPWDRKVFIFRTTREFVLSGKEFAANTSPYLSLRSISLFYRVFCYYKNFPVTVLWNCDDW